jgi:hydroxyacid-oxoacid transhydrogenase
MLRTIQFAHAPSCPCHANPGHSHHPARPSASDAHAHGRGARPLRQPGGGSTRSYATPQDPSQRKEYAFEMAASSIRFGPGVTQEVGMDLRNLGARRVCVVTDETVDKLDAMRQVRAALDREGVPYEVFNKVQVEPKDSSYVSVALSSLFPPPLVVA